MRHHRTRHALACCALAVALPGAAAAAPMDVSPTKAGGDFIAGIGIPSDGFTVDTNATSGEAVALKARLRDTGQPLGVSGNRYFLAPGFAASDPTAPAWSFDWQFTPRDGDVVTTGAVATDNTPTSPAVDYTMELSVDFDPGFGATDFAVLSAPLLDGDADPLDSWDDGDGFHHNPGGGAWTSDTIEYVYSQSWHLGFGFWTAPPFGKSFDPTRPGEYEIRLRVLDRNGAVLASTGIFAQVPEPATALLAGLALLVPGLRRRR